MIEFIVVDGGSETQLLSGYKLLSPVQFESEHMQF